MHASKYTGMSVEQWKEAFSIEDSQSFTLLVKALNQLEEEYVIIRNEQQQFLLLAEAGYFVGKLKKNPKGFGFVENEEQSVFANPNEIMYHMDGDQVLAKVINNHDGSVECKIIKVIEHAKRTIIGVIKKREGRTMFLPDTNMPRIRFKITNLKKFKLSNDTKVQLYVHRFGKVYECTIVQVLGHKYDPGMDILSVLLEYDIDPEFNEAVLSEVSEIPDHVKKSEKANRLDLRKETIITIDGDDAKDLDDAIHVKKVSGGYELGVHIADVSHYVKANSAIDQEAYRRGTSVYVVDRVVPMLPRELSNGLCSLNEKVDRLALSCIMKINKNGVVEDYSIAASLIHVCNRMSYDGVNKIIEGDTKLRKKYSHLIDMIEVAHELSLLLRKRKQELGEIDFDKRESKILVDKKGKVTDIVLRVRKEAERIIEDFMIAANECVAAHTRHAGIPSLYRVHETPDAKKMREFASLIKTMGFSLKGDVNHIYPNQLQQVLKQAKGHESYEILSTYLLRSMRQARYDAVCLGHFGLGLQEYTHFTSPIRRYPDLIVHRMLRKYFLSGNYNVDWIEQDEIFMKEASIQTSKLERNAVDAEREVDDMKKAEYMEQYIGSIYLGVISSVTKFGMFVELENTVEGLVHISTLEDDQYRYDDVSKMLIGIHSAKTFKIGQKVMVVVDNASKYKREIDFKLVEETK